MTRSEVATLLGLAAARDYRTVGEVDVLAWHEDIGDLDFTDAREALGRHFRESTDRVMPAHIRTLVRLIRDERRRVQQHEIRALPGRYEDDAERDARLKEGAAKVRQAIAPVIAKLSMERAQSWQRSREVAAGAWWEDETARERHAQQLLAEAGRLHIRCGDNSCPHCHDNAGEAT